MTYKVSFSGHIKGGGGFMLDPEALVEADSITDAEKKFLEYAKKRLEKYDVKVHTISKSTVYLVKA